uniref:Uncharacterized protein n=1 Tax=Neogobius melanostomus TaxID=47308 RepID=A0A8C6UKG1_9GOBI
SCYKEEDLENAARHKLHSHYQQIAFPAQPSTVPHVCPWILFDVCFFRKKDLPEHFPSTYYEAQCLCEGCIVLDQNGEPEENYNYNSKPETQEGRRYRLKRVDVEVNVACTCVSSSTSTV